MKKRHLGIILIMVAIYAWTLASPFRLPGAFFYGNDDQSYYSYLPLVGLEHHLKYDQLEEFPKEILYAGKNSHHHYFNPYPMGSAIFWSPGFMLGNYLFHRVHPEHSLSNGYSKIHLNVVCLWIVFGFILSLLMLMDSLKNYYSDDVSCFVILAIVFGSFLPIYIFKAPILSHSVEWILFVFLVWIFIKFLRNPTWFFAGWIGLLSAWMVHVRWNHILLGIVTFGFSGFLFKHKLKRLCGVWMMFPMFILGGLFLVWFWITFNEQVFVSKSLGVLNYQAIQSPFDRMIHILWGFDWGVWWTAPWVLLGILVFPFLWKDSKKRLLAGLLLSIVPGSIYLAVRWKTQASFYGYRYLLPLWVPAAFGLAEGLNLFYEKLKPKVRGLLWGTLIILLIVQWITMIYFESNADTLGLFLFRKHAWGNPMYISNALGAIFNGESIIHALRYSFLAVWMVIIFQPWIISFGGIEKDLFIRILPTNIDDWFVLSVYPFGVIALITIIYMVCLKDVLSNNFLNVVLKYGFMFVFLFFLLLTGWIIFYACNIHNML